MYDGLTACHGLRDLNGICDIPSIHASIELSFGKLLSFPVEKSSRNSQRISLVKQMRVDEAEPTGGKDRGVCHGANLQIISVRRASFLAW